MQFTTEDYYPERERFNPERFMSPNRDQLVPYTYLPFGSGPRNCIGMRFAYQEIKLCLTTIVRRFRFALTEKTSDVLSFRPFKPTQMCTHFLLGLNDGDSQFLVNNLSLCLNKKINPLP